MKMVSVPTFWAEIYCGLQRGYGGKVHSIEDAESLCQAYCDRVRQGLTVTPTQFVYVDGGEPGLVVGFINYPRFPTGASEIRRRALELAAILKEELGQERVSVVMPDETIMLGEV